MSRDDRKILLCLVLFGLAVRILSLMMIHTGVDERDYWFSAKRILWGLPYDEITHRTVRFAIILPIYLTQRVLGTHPNVYYVMPVLLSLLQIPLLYRIGLQVHGRKTAFLSCFMLVLFPYMIRSASQNRPEIYSLTYLLAAVLLLLRYKSAEGGGLLFLIGSALILFTAYESKVTNLFFYPGFVIAILIFKKRWQHALIFSSVLLALFIAETVLYALFLNMPFGQLQVIADTHLSDSNAALKAMPFLDLFRRYSAQYLPFYWMGLFIIFLAASVYAALSLKKKSVAALIFLSLSYFFGMTFEVKSIHPVIPAEPFIHRYFSPVLGTVLPVVAVFAAELWRKITGKFKAGERGGYPVRKYGMVLLFTIVLIAASFGSGILPRGLSMYFNNPLKPKDHPLYVNTRYREVINAAFTRGIPILSDSGVGGSNAVQTCTHFFLEKKYYENGRPPVLKRVRLFEKDFLYIVKEDREAEVSATWADTGAAVLLALRNPFRVEYTKVQDLVSLKDIDALGGEL